MITLVRGMMALTAIYGLIQTAKANSAVDAAAWLILSVAILLIEGIFYKRITARDTPTTAEQRTKPQSPF